MRVKREDLYDMYPKKWVVTVNSEWRNGNVVSCEVFGVYDTEDEAFIASDHLAACGVHKMVKEEDELEFIFVSTD